MKNVISIESVIAKAKSEIPAIAKSYNAYAMWRELGSIAEKGIRDYANSINVESFTESQAQDALDVARFKMYEIF